MQTTDLFEGWDEDMVHQGLRLLVLAGSTVLMLIRTAMGTFDPKYPRLVQRNIDVKYGKNEIFLNKIYKLLISLTDYFHTSQIFTDLVYP